MVELGKINNYYLQRLAQVKIIVITCLFLLHFDTQKREITFSN